jgi:hypothetical protein
MSIRGSNRHSAIMSVVSEDPDMAYVKTGLLAKSGTAPPPPKVEAWWRRAEAWEKPFPCCELVE